VAIKATAIEKTIAKMEAGYELVFTIRPYGVLNGFSCYGIRDSLIEKVGYFDEDISPGYAYFEDNDYMRRLHLAGIDPVESEASATHDTSSTLKAFTPEQVNIHHE
jgi:GT2 family glycosyltransferase